MKSTEEIQETFDNLLMMIVHADREKLTCGEVKEYALPIQELIDYYKGNINKEPSISLDRDWLKEVVKESVREVLKEGQFIKGSYREWLRNNVQ